MAKEKLVRRVQVPLLREDDAALGEFSHLGMDEGKLIRAFWRIGLLHRDEFFAGKPKEKLAQSVLSPATAADGKSHIKAVK